MGKSTALVKQKRTANKKGAAALAGVVATVIMFSMAPWWIAGAGVGVTGVLTYRWLAYRAKWGLRF